MITRKCEVDIGKGVPSHVERFDGSGDGSGLIEPIVPAKNLDSPMVEDLISGLLECERAVLASLAKRRRSFDVASKKRFPGKIKPIGESLERSDCLALSNATSFRFGA